MQRDVVPPPQQLCRQRVVAQAAAAVHRAAAPAVIEKDLHASRRELELRGTRVNRAAAVQVIEQVALVRLVPADLVGGNRAEVQPVHVRRAHEAPRRALVVADEP